MAKAPAIQAPPAEPETLDAPVRPTGPNAARLAVEARCKAAIELAAMDLPGTAADQAQRARDLMAFVDPQVRPPEAAKEQVAMLWMVVRQRKEGWKLESHAIEEMTFDPDGRRATVPLRYQFTHALYGRREIRETQTWIFRQREWYFLPEPPKDRVRPQGPPRDRTGPPPGRGGGEQPPPVEGGNPTPRDRKQ
jgi:hypothetical protein